MVVGMSVAASPLGCAATDPPAAQGAGRPLDSGAFVLVASDYRSTNVALRDAEGSSLSRSLISTASASAGLSFALSGDVVLPSEPVPRGGEVVLVDRYGTNVLTFVEPVSGVVRAQLPVGCGFESNPQDVLALEPNRALVTRFGTDPRSTDLPCGGGDDVLVIDPAAPRIVRRIALPPKEGVPARPGSMTRAGDRVYVNLHRLSADFDRAVDGDLAMLSARTAELEALVPLPGLRNCGKPVFSAFGNIAFACSGLFDPARSRFDPVGAGVVVGTLDGTTLRIDDRWDASELGVSPTGSVAWLDGATVLFTAYGDASRGDAIHLVRRGTSTSIRVASSLRPFTIGPLRCTEAPTVRCATTDAAASALVVLEPSADPRSVLPTVRTWAAPDVTGLPLRDLAFFR
jgi:hypothetical protein